MKASLFKRILAAVTVFCLCVITTIISLEYIKSNKEREYWEDTYSSECKSASTPKGYKIVNTKTGKTTIDKIDWLLASDQHKDSLVLFSKKRKRGYFNRFTGEIAIPEQYSHAWIFAEGLAAVVSNDKVGFINRQGKVVIDFQYPYFKENEKSVSFVFRNGYCSMFDESGKCGIINRKGEWVLRPVYDYIATPVFGKRLFINDGKYGVLDDSLQIAIPAEYTYIELMEESATVTRADESKSLLSYQGEVLNSCVYSSIVRLDYDTGKYTDDGTEISEPTGLYCYGMINSYGLMSEEGKTITSPLYSDIRTINKELFLCKLKNTFTYVIINRKGEIVQAETNAEKSLRIK